jgi:hypothetical protein
VTFLTKIYILFLQAKDFVEIDDILDTVTGSDSECDVLSSGDELDDDGDGSWIMFKVVVVAIMMMILALVVVRTVTTMELLVVIAVMTMMTTMMIMYLWPVERKVSKCISLKSNNHLCHVRYPRLFQNPRYLLSERIPVEYERIPVEYVNMFLTDDMIDNLVEESNKYATEKTGSCPNFTKTEMTTYVGIYYLMGIVRLPKIGNYWRSDLWYGQFYLSD